MGEKDGPDRAYSNVSRKNPFLKSTVEEVVSQGTGEGAGRPKKKPLVPAKESNDDYDGDVVEF